MFLNVMMDGSMFPRGWHPRADAMTRDCKRTTIPTTRTLRPPKYYLIDFGISRRYNLDEDAPLEHPIFGGDKSVPEFKKSIAPCNPFPTDIYYMGNFIRTEFLEVGERCMMTKDMLTRSSFI